MLITNDDKTLIFLSGFIKRYESTQASTTLVFLVLMKSMKALSHLLTSLSSEDADMTLSDRLYAWDTIILGLLYTLLRLAGASVWAT